MDIVCKVFYIVCKKVKKVILYNCGQQTIPKYFKTTLQVFVIIVTRDMVWKLGELQSVYNELQFNVETASPCTNLLKFC